MKKNGFTLIELLAVITILAITAIIVIVKIDKNIKDTQDFADDMQKGLGVSADELKEMFPDKQFSPWNKFGTKK